jgi:hypothetical protein
MNSSDDSNRNSAILLLNEIDKLLAQTRSMEFLVEQARAAGEEKISRLQDEVQQLESERRAKVHELQIQLAAKQLLVDGRAAEIEDLRSVISALSAQVVAHDRVARDTKGNVISPSGTIRGASGAGITMRREQEFVMKSDDQDASPSQRATELASAQANLDTGLRDEVNRLIREAQEKNQILRDRNEELVRVKAELDSLHERLTQLESAHSEAEIALRHDSERMRTEFQAQLALLQAELSQREWTLEERDAVARGLEQNLRQEIEALRQKLAESKAARRYDPDALLFDEGSAPHVREQHLEAIAGAVHAEPRSRSVGYKRRWNSELRWKRRWRS